MKQTAVLLVAVIFAWGCVSTPKRNPLPETLVEEAEIPGIPDAREWGDTPLPHEDEWFAQSEEELRARYPALFGQEHLARQHHALTAVAILGNAERELLIQELV